MATIPLVGTEAVLKPVHAATVDRPPGSRTLNNGRRTVLPALDAVSRTLLERPLQRDKTDRDDEHMLDIEAELGVIERHLWDAGYRRNALSTLKYIQEDDEIRWEQSSLARFGDEWMHHAFMFALPDRTGYALYHHKEYHYLHDARKHQHGERFPGDPDDKLPAFEGLSVQSTG